MTPRSRIDPDRTASEAGWEGLRRWGVRAQPVRATDHLCPPPFAELPEARARILSRSLPRWLALPHSPARFASIGGVLFFRQARTVTGPSCRAGVRTGFGCARQVRC